MDYPKQTDETVVFTFDFSDIHESVVSAVVTASWYRGKPDPNPEAIVLGNALINGAMVMQKITGGQDGTVYLLTCEVESDDGLRSTLQDLLWTRSRNV